MWVITEGLNPGERVVAEGVQKVRPGVQVNPKSSVAQTAGSEPGKEPAKEPAKEER
jgi:membrane fusion protein, multidrug efflux system